MNHKASRSRDPKQRGSTTTAESTEPLALLIIGGTGCWRYFVHLAIDSWSNATGVLGAGFGSGRRSSGSRSLYTDVELLNLLNHNHEHPLLYWYVYADFCFG